MYHSLGTRIKMFALAFLLSLVVVTSKSIGSPSTEQQSYPKNRLEFSVSDLMEDRPRDLQFFKYLLANELLDRQRNSFDWEEQQKKRSYWKQCAFNAISCFGKK